MNKTIKILFFLLVVFLLLVVIALLANFIYFKNAGNVGVSQTSEISGQETSDFIVETYATSDSLSFVFSPRNEGEKDYYLSYTLSRGDMPPNVVENKLMEDVSRDNPIEIDLNRDSSLEYSLETTIRDTKNGGNILHKDKMVIHPLEVKREDAGLEKVEEFIRQNISDLSPEEAVLGGTFYVTDIVFLNDNTATVEYEDGHIALKANVEYDLSPKGEVEINNFEIIER